MKVSIFRVKSTKSKFDIFAGYNSSVVKMSFDNNEFLFLIA